jgi:polysaccharide biosynthesis transport protein
MERSEPPSSDYQETESRRHHHSRSPGRFWNKLHRYQVVLAEKWWIPVLCLLLGAAIAGSISWFGPPSFTSVGRMIVSMKLSIPEGSVYSEEMSSFLGTQSALMQSGVVLSRAQARLMATSTNFSLHPVTLKVSVVPRTSIFVLQATGNDPEATEAWLQACMEEYIGVKREMRTQTSDTTIAGLTEQLVRLEKDVQQSEAELALFQKTNNVVLFEEQKAAAANYVTALNQKLADMKSEQELLQMLTIDQNLQRQQALATTTATPTAGSPATTTGPAADPTPGSAPSSLGAGDNNDSLAADYFRGKQQLLLMKAEMQDLAQYLRPRHPKMIAMNEDIARRERLLEIYRQQGSEQLENRKASLALQIENLKQQITESTQKALAINRETAEFQRLKANLDRVRSLYDHLQSTLQSLDVNKEVSPESVTIMERASHAYPDRPKFSMQVLQGALIGLALSIGLLMFVERMDDRMTSFTEVQDLFDEEILGQIPRERVRDRRSGPGLIQVDDERHAFVEAYRNLRSSLLYMKEMGQHPKTLLVTSTVPNDGKSLTSANFAVILAHSGSRVLLVDADLRKGGQHHRFGVEPEPGLCEVLSQGLKWQEVVKPTETPNLFLLPRGCATQKSSELFISKATAGFLKEVAAQYDYVIIDTAPVMAADDVTSLAPHIDGVLFVIRAEQTSARVARAALDLLYQRQVNVLGLVLNSVHPRRGDYYYYYKYEDYYHAYPATKGEQEKRRRSRH